MWMSEKYKYSNMNINIMKRLIVHGTGFKLLLHVSIFTGSSFRQSPELIIVVT